MGMLIGYTVTLADLEKKIQEKLYELEMTIPKMNKEYAGLKQKFDTLPRIIEDEKKGEIVNPEWKIIPDQMKELELQIKESQDMMMYLKEKVDELSDIEERSKGRGNIDKSKNKITLSLKDCLQLGIDFSDDKRPETVGR